jgi:GT2 family glycosyltransferase
MEKCYIIVNKNDYKSTKHLVDNIIDYKIIDHILIIDNASTQEERRLIESITNEKLEKIYNGEDKGYSSAINRACNYLIEKYKNCIFIISNSDIVIMDESDIEKLVEDLSYDCIGLVGPQLLERGKILKGRMIPTPKQDIISNLNMKYTSIEYPEEYYKDKTSFVDVISSAFFLMTSDTFKKIDGLDDKVFLYYEDNILACKMIKNKLYTLIDNRVKVKHNFSSTIEKEINDYNKFKILSESQMYFHEVYSKAKPYELSLLKSSIKYRFLKYKTMKKFK